MSHVLFDSYKITVTGFAPSPPKKHVQNEQVFPFMLKVIVVRQISCISVLATQPEDSVVVSIF